MQADAIPLLKTVRFREKASAEAKRSFVSVNSLILRLGVFILQ